MAGSAQVLDDHSAPATTDSYTTRTPRRGRTESTDISLGQSNGSTQSPSPATKKRKIQYQCEPCGTTYTEKRALARHRHTAQHRRNVGLPPTEKYACSLCPKTFSREHDRVRHVNETHNGQKRSARCKDASETPLPAGLRSEWTPPSWQSARPQLDSQYGEQKGSMLEDHVYARQNEWDTLGTRMEVYSGPAIYDFSSYRDPASAGRSAPESSTFSPISDQTAPSSSSEPRRSGSHSERQNSQSWFAESSEDEDEGIARSESHPHQKSAASTAADSAIDMSEASQEGHEAKCPSITTFDYRNEQHEERSRSSHDQDVETELANFKDLSLKAVPRATVVQGRGKTTVIPAWRPSLCVFCNEPFEDDYRSLLTHLRKHLDDLQGESSHVCPICQVGFTNKHDLSKHQVMADITHHCGFQFDHKHPCTGHHRPTGLHCPDFVDADRFQLCVQLRHWEQQQLKAYMASIDELVASQNRRASTCYSIEQLGRRSSMASFSSYAASVNTYSSAPCDGADGTMDVGGLQKRLRFRALKSSAKILPKMLRKSDAQSGITTGSRPPVPANAEWSDPGTVKLLLGLGANINTHDNVYGSSLASAARQGKLEIVQLLIKDGANVRQAGGKYGSALGAAAAGSHCEVADLLLKHGADINASSGMSGPPLSVAAAGGQTRMVQWLLDRGADVNHTGGDEGSPIGFAVWYGRSNVVSMLAQRGALLNIKGGKHGSPLSAAVEAVARGKTDLRMVKTLLDHGANANHQA